MKSCNILILYISAHVFVFYICILILHFLVFKNTKKFHPGSQIISIKVTNRFCCSSVTRRIYQPRGRVWGGSSSLNAMVYIRGHAYDYDRWEKEGAEGWSYADCLPYFKKSQTHELGEFISDIPHLLFYFICSSFLLLSPPLPSPLPFSPLFSSPLLSSPLPSPLPISSPLLSTSLSSDFFSSLPFNFFTQTCKE